MEDSFFEYLQQLEMMAFFTGYPIVYALIVFLKGNEKSKNNIRNKLFTLLPIGYALAGLLFTGLQLKKLYPDYSIAYINTEFQNSYLAIWGLLSLLFFIPFFYKKPILSLLHSLVFFSLLIKDLFLHLTSSNGDNNVVKNDMNVYTSSILLNISTLLISLVFYLVIKGLRKKH